MKPIKKKNKFEYDQTLSVNTVYGTPESCAELLNKYGTYNIQPTAEADNLYPAIAHGMPKDDTDEKEKKKDNKKK